MIKMKSTTHPGPLVALASITCEAQTLSSKITKLFNQVTDPQLKDQLNNIGPDAATVFMKLQQLLEQYLQSK
jgi:hypothetical protein